MDVLKTHEWDNPYMAVQERILSIKNPSQSKTFRDYVLKITGAQYLELFGNALRKGRTDIMRLALDIRKTNNLPLSPAG